MKQFKEIYELNQLADARFMDECIVTKEEMIRKNLLELLVELGEFANETKCFKYWSSKKPSSKEIILDEYSDCLMLVLFFCNILNMDLDEEYPSANTEDVVDTFIYLYHKVSLLKNNLCINDVKDILSNLIGLGYKLGYNDQDIIDAFKKKTKKNDERAKTNFSY